MRCNAKHFDELRAYCETIPLVDCHDHADTCRPYYPDPIKSIVDSYFRSDLISVSSIKDIEFIENQELSLEERWPILKRAWQRTQHTGYARMIRLALKRFYDIDELSLEALHKMKDNPVDLREPKAYEAVLEEANIAVQLQNLWLDVRTVINDTLKLTPRARLVIGLPIYHRINSRQSVQEAIAPLGGRQVTSLSEYLDACRAIFEAYKKIGAVAFKDQSAYYRDLGYNNPTRQEAEAVFNWFMEDPRRHAALPDGIRPLSDFLFHEFMRMARNMDLPVQIHTGHMAGTHNEISKTNAVLMTRVFELHSDVQFDLFHANWPYSGELLFLCKNYPNVNIDFCWTHIIDPVYCQNLLVQILSSVPHGKVHGYGSDLGRADYAWAHAKMARDNIAIALANMVEMNYLDLDDARQVARMWMYENANNFFRLGLPALRG